MWLFVVRVFMNVMVKVMYKNCSILDCTAPFSVQIVTDAFTDMGDAATANDFDNSRGLIFLCISCVAYKLYYITGVCLEWTQIPCQG